MASGDLVAEDHRVRDLDGASPAKVRVPPLASCVSWCLLVSVCLSPGLVSFIILVYSAHYILLTY